MENKINDIVQKFIKDNDLSFVGTDSELNGNLCILCGYLHYLRIIIGAEMLATLLPSVPIALYNKVNSYCITHNYGEWWKQEEARKLYKF